MTTAEIDAKLLRAIKTTQKLLGEHICKPPLLEKYLVKPPFRFIHDIVCSVISSTSFMKDVYTPDELKYENISSPDAKRSFLKRAIDFLENSSGEVCAARPSKILAGKEPERTNELLHLLAKSVTKWSKVKSEESARQREGEDEKKIQKKKEGDEKKAKEKRAEVVKVKEGVGKTAKSKPVPPSTAVIKTKPKTELSSGKEAKVDDHHSKSVKQTTVAKSKSLLHAPNSPVKKIPSRDILKSKPETPKPSASSSASSLARKNSSSNIEKAKSKTSIGRKASGSKLTAHPETKNAHKKSKENLIVATVSRTVSDVGVSRDSSEKKCSSAVTLQRPVTRTKYRQGNHSGEASADSTKSGTLGEGLDVSAEDADEEASRASSTSSDEVITDDMNRKISEWRTSSAEDIGENAPTSLKRGWIPSETELAKGGENSEKVCAVFESQENCSAEGGGGQGSEKGAGENGSSTISQNNKAQQFQKRPVTVIMDNDEDDEDETYLVQERKESLEDMVAQSVGIVNSVTDIGLLSEGNRSLLVNQILETKRELEMFGSGADQAIPNMNGLVERDQEIMRERYQKQVEDLKEAIQKITKCATPLANIAQRSQDDACLMEIEFRKLKQENERLQRRIDEAKEETARALYPFTEELTNLDSCIEKMEGAIALAKQRLHVMDEEFSEDFIEQIAQTPTQDEFLALNQKENSCTQQNQLWGGIPQSDVIRDDAEHELKMRNTSLRNIFHLALDMHESQSQQYEYGMTTDSPRQFQKMNYHSRGGYYHPTFSPRRGPTGGIHLEPRNSNVDAGFHMNGGARMPVSQIPQPIRQPFHQFAPQPQNFGISRSNNSSQQYHQQKPHLETEIKPSWWD